MVTRCTAILLAGSLFATSLAAQSTSVGGEITPEVRSAANEAYQKKDWKAAAETFEKIVKVEDKNFGARYRYGIALMNLNKNAEAKQAFETVFTAAPNAVFGLALARANARLADTKAALEVLEKTIKLGGASAETLNGEADFAGLKSDAKFQDVVKRADIAANPCKASPEFRQFDFWIGEWDPKNVQGIVVGSSSIQLILGQCIIFENWSTPVSSGKSFNVFNTTDKKWHQTWVDDKGTFTHYIGGLVDGKMLLDSESVVNGKKTIARMTYSKLANGDVRQHGENSADEGKTWTTSFDFTYVRKK